MILKLRSLSQNVQPRALGAVQVEALSGCEPPPKSGANRSDVGSYSPASILERGSRKSLSASPMKLNESTASITAAAGKITRCGASNRCERASFNMEPQLAAGGGTPRPR